MRIAIMQPYFFPYIGYFQLISSADKFIFYDDVNHMKQGWINRNRIQVNGQETFFTVPLKNQSSNTKIYDLGIKLDLFLKWRKKFIKTIEQTYKKAPYFDQTFKLINEVLFHETDKIATLSKKSIEVVCKYLAIDTRMISSSRIYNNENLKADKRILDICLQESCTTYLNMIDGKILYNSKSFNRNNIRLHFLQANLPNYEQEMSKFIPGLSIIDILMYNSLDNIKIMLNKATILKS